MSIRVFPTENNNLIAYLLPIEVIAISQVIAGAAALLNVAEHNLLVPEVTAAGTAVALGGVGTSLAAWTSRGKVVGLDAETPAGGCGILEQQRTPPSAFVVPETSNRTAVGPLASAHLLLGS